MHANADSTSAARASPNRARSSRSDATGS